MKWVLNQSKDHIEARKEILSSSTDHLPTTESTGLRKALAILEPFVNLLPLLGAQVWLEEQSGKQENVPGGERDVWTQEEQVPLRALS